MARERDSQRSKVYRAERQADITGERFPEIPGVEAYLRRVFSHKWFKRRYPRAFRFRVHDGRGRRSALGWSAGLTIEMKLPKWARTEGIILHELAHGLTDQKAGYRIRHAAHGWEFCETFLALVYHYQGGVAGNRLKESFGENRVRFRKPRVGRKLTPEQRSAAIERLAAARETRAAKTRAE